MALSTVRCPLIPAARFATAGPVAEVATLLAAIALPAIVAITDVERLPAMETPDLDEVDRIRPTHTAELRDDG